MDLTLNPYTLFSVSRLFGGKKVVGWRLLGLQTWAKGFGFEVSGVIPGLG